MTRSMKRKNNRAMNYLWAKVAVYTNVRKRDWIFVDFSFFYIFRKLLKNLNQKLKRDRKVKGIDDGVKNFQKATTQIDPSKLTEERLVILTKQFDFCPYLVSTELRSWLYI